MTVKLSQQKISRLLKYYFAGMTQPAIAQKVGTDQSTISLYARRFSERAAEIGLLAAAKEYDLYTEVSELRNLSVEMQKSNLTTEDARQGVGMIKAFSKLGVPTDQHTKLIQVAKKIDNAGFINASLELVRIEEKEQISYEKAVNKYSTVVSQLPLKEDELSRVQTRIDSLNHSIAKRDGDLRNLEAAAKRIQLEHTERKTRLEQEYTARWRQLDVRQKDIEEVAQLKARLGKDNLDIATLVQLAKEYSGGTQQVDGMLIRRDIEMHHSLRRSNEALVNAVAVQNQEYTKLKSKNSELNLENDRVVAKIIDNRGQIIVEEQKLSQLVATINSYSRQYALLQGFLAMVGNSPAVNRPIESLIDTLRMIMRSGWYTSRTEKEWMGLFVQRVFGDYLQSFRCDHCGGSRFMVSRGADKAYTYYPPVCPVCYSSKRVKPDDSFLRAMVSEEQLKNVYRAEILMRNNTILKPFSVLVNRPCEVCHKQINDWTEDKVMKFATGLGWAHEKCRKTFTGILAQIGLVTSYVPTVEEKPSQEVSKNAGKPTVPTLRVNF